MSPPRIAVAPNRRPGDYLEAVRLAGGAPELLVPVRDTALALLETADGLLLTGGGDIAPHLYGQPPHPTFDPAEPGRDAVELELAIRAVERDLPLLCICRGVQVLNVALGGTLIQDIPSARPQALRHRIDQPLDQLAHEVHVAEGSRLATLLLADTAEGPACRVNSRHHQAIQRVAPGLVVSATAPDGTVEAVERPASAFCLGVQWHPENFWRSGRFRTLFEAFVAAAREYRTGRVSVRIG